MKTRICICPFAQFGNPGTMAGAELLGDALREMLDDAIEEDRQSRSSAFAPHVEIQEMPFRTSDDYGSWHRRASELIGQTLDTGEFLIWIGGNHLSVLPLYEAMACRDGSLVVQLDAHLDLYHLKDCVPELSHGNFLRHVDPLPGIINIGHRDLFLPREEIARHYRRATSVSDLLRDERRELGEITTAITAATQVMFDLDVDVLDPAFFPAVVDVLPFGLNPQQILSVLNAIETSKLGAVAISEFEPGRDVNDRSLGLLIWLVEWILITKYESSANR